MLNRRNFLTAAVGVAATAGLAACAKEDGSSSDSSSGGSKAITLGFAQVGSESGWRTANTLSIQESAKTAGIDLKFSDAQQKQENQISAIRSFIAQKVDVIAFSPVVVTGWDAVLKEAQSAKIPVVLTDRSVESDESLFVTLVGSDFTDEGRRAAKILEKVLEKAGHKGKVKIAQLEGTTGAAPAIERAKGFKEVMDAEHKDDWEIVASQTGDFTRAGGKQVMAAFLQSNPDIDVLFAHNDDMGLGAIQAIEAAGKKPGKDILIVTVDGVKDGFIAMSEGKINAIVECNPLLGPQLMDLVKKVAAGEQVPQRIETQETEFDQAKAKEALPQRQY